jgi:hypothetical protein
MPCLRQQAMGLTILSCTFFFSLQQENEDFFAQCYVTNAFRYTMLQHAVCLACASRQWA